MSSRPIFPAELTARADIRALSEFLLALDRMDARARLAAIEYVLAMSGLVPSPHVRLAREP